MAGPSSSATPEVRAALRKLVQALPETFRAEAEVAASAVVLDPDSWDRQHAPPPEHLDVLRRAVVDGVQVRLGYSGRDRRASERTVHPLGLVVKGSVWYLVAGTDAGLRTFRVSRVRSVEVTDRPVERPEAFDLAKTWSSTVAAVNEQRAPLRVIARADQQVLGWLRDRFGNRIALGETGPDGRVEIVVRAHNAGSVAADFAGFGDRVEVVEPPEVRDVLARLGAELARSYRP
ncbi:MAG: helix-turn-helix transcriptional regulator [Acidimicrobiia bacterium]